MLFDFLADVLIARGPRLVALIAAGGVAGSWIASSWLGVIPGVAIGFAVGLSLEVRSDKRERDDDRAV